MKSRPKYVCVPAWSSVAQMTCSICLFIASRPARFLPRDPRGAMILLNDHRSAWPRAKRAMPKSANNTARAPARGHVPSAVRQRNVPGITDTVSATSQSQVPRHAHNDPPLRGPMKSATSTSTISGTARRKGQPSLTGVANNIPANQIDNTATRVQLTTHHLRSPLILWTR